MALVSGNSLRWRGGGDGRMSVDRLFNSGGGGFARTNVLSRIPAALKLFRLRIWCPVSSEATYALWTLSLAF